MERSSARAAIAALPRQGRVYMAPACGAPLALGEALAAERDRFDGLTIYRGLMFTPEPWLDAVGAELRLVSLHPTGATEPLITAGKADYLPLRYSRIPATFAAGGPLAVDAALIQVSPPDARGWCTLGPTVSTSLAIARSAPLVIAEINERCPRVHGEGALHIDDIDIAVACDHPLVELAPARVGDTERHIAAQVAALVPDGATIQIGIGAVPQAILGALAGHHDLGVHSGMLCDDMLPLIEAGVITGARKSLDPHKLVAGEGLGTARLFAFLHDNPSVRLVPATMSHGLEYLREQERFVSLNSALQVDLTGQVNAEWIGGRQVSGLGGQFDFVEAALYSRGGFGVVALPATAAGGKASRIVARLDAGAAVTTPRSCVDYVVTEYGVADLRHATLRERGERLSAIAHPDFRAELLAALARA